LLKCFLMFGLWTLQQVSCFVWIHLLYDFIDSMNSFFIRTHVIKMILNCDEFFYHVWIHLFLYVILTLT
jgi:hypothetical protein